MSADNGIYIGKFSETDYRVIEASAIDNIFWPDGENAEYILNYFGNANVCDTLIEAYTEADKMYTEFMNDDFGILEYGISVINFSKTIDEYVQEMISTNHEI
jgi:hypothetical protein